MCVCGRVSTCLHIKLFASVIAVMFTELKVVNRFAFTGCILEAGKNVFPEQSFDCPPIDFRFISLGSLV